MRASHLFAPPLAMMTTAGLLLVMYSLIHTNYELPPVVDTPKPESVIMPDRNVGPARAKEPTRPETPPKAPPPVADPAMQTNVADATSVSMPVPSAGDTGGTPLNDHAGGEYMPIVKVAPQYPRRALARGIEGYVTVSFTVTETGRTRDVVVLEAVTKEGKATSIFDRAAKAAAEKFKYQPRVQDGVAVEVYDVKNRFVFEME